MENDNNSSPTCCSLVLDRHFLLPLAISSSCFVLQTLSGADSVSYFIGIIFKDSTLMKAEYAAIIYQAGVRFKAVW